MLTTSVSLPISVAPCWQAHQRAIMRLAIRILRVRMRGNPVRRGVKRTYNTASGGYQIVTTRFTEAEYDTLHFAGFVTESLLFYAKPTARNGVELRKLIRMQT